MSELEEKTREFMNEIEKFKGVEITRGIGSPTLSTVNFCFPLNTELTIFMNYLKNDETKRIVEDPRANSDDSEGRIHYHASFTNKKEAEELVTKVRRYKIEHPELLKSTTAQTF